MIYLLIVLSLSLPHQDTIFGGFAPQSQTAEVLSKALGNQTVQSGSFNKGKDRSTSIQMMGRPLQYCQVMNSE